MPNMLFNKLIGNNKGEKMKKHLTYVKTYATIQ